MRQFIIASHGKMAHGLRDSLEIIIGQQDNIHVFGFYSSENQNELQIKKDIVSFFDKYPDDHFIVFTDLLGGSVNQYFISLLKSYDFELFTGVNLPLLLEVILNEKSTVNKKEIENAVCTGSTSLVYVNEEIKKIRILEDE